MFSLFRVVCFDGVDCAFVAKFIALNENDVNDYMKASDCEVLKVINDGRITKEDLEELKKSIKAEDQACIDRFYNMYF